MTTHTQSKDAVRGFLAHLESTDNADSLRHLLKTFVEQLMSADVDNTCNANLGERTPERTNQRNGYRDRPWDTRLGSIRLSVPKVRRGSYFPDWLLERRRRAEKALVSVVAESYVLGVSTRRVDGLVKALGVDGISKSQVSEMAKTLDDEVKAFRNRPLDRGPYVYVWVDAMMVRVREAGRVVNVALAIATGVNKDGAREVLGVDVFTEESGPAWKGFLRGLVERGLSGVTLIVSDAHDGLKQAIATVLPGASWQRCRTHFMRNVLTKVPKSMHGAIGALVRSTFAQPDAENVRAQYRRVIEQLEDKFPAIATMLDEAEADLLAFASFPKEHWKQLWSNNPSERLNKEVRRRTDVVGIFPDRDSVIRLVGAVLAEQNDEWAELQRRYMSLESLQKSSTPSEPTPALLPPSEKTAGQGGSKLEAGHRGPERRR
jgi:transposase-like protein